MVNISNLSLNWDDRSKNLKQALIKKVYNCAIYFKHRIVYAKNYDNR